ncbi:MlaD family protein [Nocardia sp. NPDC052278]|uniref:MlaD family protein n=1 Tax=unclassified Nocardia TaxID=2637762 RepID=UPI0036A6DC34
MKLRRKLAARAGAVLLCCATISTASCSLGPQDIPMLGSRAPGDGDRIHLQFDNVMNLPAGAYVMLDGLRVGKVEKVAVTGADVTVTAVLTEGTHVPSDVHATIRQDTLLGDTYIGLDRDPNELAGKFLPPGGTVPQTRTSSPPQPEDTMAVLAYFVNGGSIQKIQDTMSRINAVMPAVAELQRLSTVLTGDFHDLAQNTDEIDRLLSGFDRTATSISGKSDTLNLVLFNDTALNYWRQSDRVLLGRVSTGLPSIGSLFFGGYWMVPMLDSLADTVHTGRGMWDTTPEAVDRVATFLRTVVLPFAQHPSVNIRSVESANGDQLVGDMENLLRMLGAMK